MITISFILHVQTASCHLLLLVLPLLKTSESFFTAIPCPDDTSKKEKRKKFSFTQAFVHFSPVVRSKSKPCQQLPEERHQKEQE